MRNVLTFLAVSFLFAACGPSVQYIGRTYPPTQNVDIYFNASDITKQYEVIGKVNGYASAKFDAIQNKIIKEAKQKGADGVIFTGMGEKVVGTTNNTSTVANGGSMDNKRGDSVNGKTSATAWNASVLTTTTTTNQTTKVVSADFIKYK